jgi:hypothetical protein
MEVLWKNTGDEKGNLNEEGYNETKKAIIEFIEEVFWEEIEEYGKIKAKTRKQLEVVVDDFMEKVI